MSEEKDHRHNKAPKSRLWIVLFITTFFMFVEVIGGILSNSLALLADAGHMLNDVASIMLSLFAIYMSGKSGSLNLTYGFKRIEVLSGLINGISLLSIAIFIIRESIDRFFNEKLEINGSMMLIIAFIGLLVNIGGIFLLTEEKEGSINIEGAYHHIIADALGSIAAIIAGIGIILFRAYWLDLLASTIVAILVFKSGFSLTKRAILILMEAKPDHVNMDDLVEDLLAIDDVLEICDLHSWRITDGMDAFTAHLVTENIDNYDRIKNRAIDIVKKKGFQHITIQMEQKACYEYSHNCFKRDNKIKKEILEN